MFLDKTLADQIVMNSMTHIGRHFDLSNFNCVHFVREVYGSVGIEFPILRRDIIPPREFHLSEYEFCAMPVGQSVFFKRRESSLVRPWTHVAIIISSTDLIHCTRNLGDGVVITSRDIFLEKYCLAKCC